MLSKNRIILIPERKTFAPKKTNVKDMRTPKGAIGHKSQPVFIRFFLKTACINSEKRPGQRIGSDAEGGTLANGSNATATKRDQPHQDQVSPKSTKRQRKRKF